MIIIPDKNGYNGFYKDPEYIRKQRESHLGKKNGRWKHGLSVNKRRHGKYVIGSGKTRMTRKEYINSDLNPGKHKSIEVRKSISIRHKGKGNPFWGGHQTNEAKEKIRNGSRKWWKNKDNKERHRKIMIQYWKDKTWAENVIKAQLKGMFKRPTSLERQMIDIIKKHNLPYKYTGDGSFLIGYKNPDFINTNGEKICIEIYYDYFKIRDFGSCKNYEIKRSNHFSKYGWKTVFVNTNQRKEILNEKEILNKLVEVNHYG